MGTPKRWRKIKSAQKTTPLAHSVKKSQWINIYNFSLKKQLQLMHASERLKAFITDMFMINMPLLYLTTYVFLDGKEAFTHNQSVIFACGIGYGFITSLFLISMFFLQFFITDLRFHQDPAPKPLKAPTLQ